MIFARGSSSCHAVTEAHEPLVGVLVLDACDERVEVLAAVLQLREHLHDRHVCAAVQRPAHRAQTPAATEAYRLACDEPTCAGRRGAVLLVVGVQQQELVERPDG